MLSRLFSRLSARGFLTTFSSFVFVHNLLHLLYLLYFLNSNSVFRSNQMPNECGGVAQEVFLLEVLSSGEHRKDKAISASRGLLEKG